jgi:hypothetical protein
MIITKGVDIRCWVDPLIIDPLLVDSSFDQSVARLVAGQFLQIIQSKAINRPFPGLGHDTRRSDSTFMLVSSLCSTSPWAA